jgi:glycerol-3-phosphate dehydrogenase
MVHGGLRYLQNFDLGLVREALVERQLMVLLAPHLVYPTPFLVPSLGEKKRSRRLGAGLNLYDVMATRRVGEGRSEQAELRKDEGYWSPDRHRTIDGEEAAKLIPALAPRDPAEAYLFYDCQTDDVRLTLTILGEAERFGATLLNGAEVTEVLDDDGRATGVTFVESTRPGSGRIASRPRRSRPRRTCRTSGRAAGPTSRSPSRISRSARRPASFRPARTARSSPCRGTGGR